VDNGVGGEKLENFADTGPAEHVNLVGLGGSADKWEAEHGIAEVVEFDDKETGFHRANQRRLR
jgi:hypothetical protein